MKAYGYAKGSDESILLDQITLEITPNEMHRFCEFLMQCSIEMKADDDWNHEHFSDFCGEVLVPEIVVYRSRSEESSG